MSFTGVFGLVFLAIVAIALLGPSKLPAGLEQLWLMISNFRRSQAELPPLTLAQARRIWEESESPFTSSATRATLRTYRAPCSSLWATLSVHDSLLPHGGRNTPPLCCTRKCRWLIAVEMPRNSR